VLNLSQYQSSNYVAKPYYQKKHVTGKQKEKICKPMEWIRKPRKSPYYNHLILDS
jgi:hypothetical protein